MYKKAKDIVVGDKIWSVAWDGLDDEFTLDPYTWSSDSVQNIHTVESEITGIIPSIKDITVSINNDNDKRFSLEQTILILRNSVYFFGTTGILEVGDTVIEYQENGSFEHIPVTNISIIDEQRTVYEFDASPNDILLAGNLIVHNRKIFA